MSIAANFNLLDEFNILRLICGLFMIPHIYGKFYVPAALGFFVAAGFKPPKFWMYLAGAIEEYQEALRLNPKNERARAGLEEALAARMTAPDSSPRPAPARN